MSFSHAAGASPGIERDLRGCRASPLRDRLPRAPSPPRSRMATLTSSLCSNDRLSKLVVPITAHSSSTSSAFTCVMPALVLEDPARRLRAAARTSRRLGEPDPALIGVAAGHDDDDRDAAAGRAADRRCETPCPAGSTAWRSARCAVAPSTSVWNSARDAVERSAGRALDRERRDVADQRVRLVGLRPGQDLAAALEPVLRRRRPECPTRPAPRCAPSCRATSACRRIGLAHQSATPAPPANATRAVDDQQLAVGPVVQPAEAIPRVNR